MNSLKGSLLSMAIFLLCHEVEMSCGKCAEKIENAMKKHSFISETNVSLSKGTVLLSSKKEFSTTEKEAVLKTYMELGYKAKVVSCERSL